jgi:TonB-dependent starch-binding outer membrane protein SusC
MPRRFFIALATASFLAPALAVAQTPPQTTQGAVITGVVRSDAQSIIPGANVRIQALTLSTVTNDLGQYRLVIPAAQLGREVVIESRAIGYAATSVRLIPRAGAQTQNITMATQAVQLDQVVVSGTAGRQEKRAQSAAVGQIEASKIAEIAPVTTLASMLQARTPGMVLRNQSGTSGTASTIRIRGASSITQSNDPLVYVDGIRVDASNRQAYGVGNQQGTALNDIKMEDIESIDIVKGPAAATLYGSDAAAGVINIITKKGRVGAGFVQSFNVEYGNISPNFTPPDNYGMCTAAAIANTTAFPNCTGKAVGTVLNDNPLGRDAAFGNGRTRNVNYSLSGGGANYSSYFSLGGNGEWGIVPHSFYGQLNSRASFNYAVRENLRMDFQMGLIRVRTDLPRNDNDIYGYLGGGMLGDPRTIGARKDGWYAQRQTEATGSYENSDKTMRFQPRAGVEYQPFTWFRNKLTVGADMQRQEAFQLWAKNDQGWWDNAPQNTGQVGNLRGVEDRFTIDYLGTVTRNLPRELRLDLSVGTQALARRTDATNVTGQGLVNNDVRSVNAAATLLNGGQSSSENRTIGVFTQADISWREKLYLQLGIRRDQGSAFGAESKPFLSPKIGLAYVVSDEDYFQNLIGFLPHGAITQLKIRGAYGVSGRQPTSGARSTFNPSTNLIAPNTLVVGVRPSTTGNPDLRPEKSQELEFGIESGFINDRLGLEATYFHKKGIDQILGLPVPGSLGASGPSVNVGALLNEGFEVAADARVLTYNNVAFTMRGTLATLKNRLLDLGGVPQSATRKVGFPLNGAWDYRIDSISVERNRVYVSDSLEFMGNGSNYPGWNTALSGTLTLFKNFSFYAQVDGQGDNMVTDGTTEFRDRQFGTSDVAVIGAKAFGTKEDGTPTDEAVIQYMRKFGPFVTKSGTNLSRTVVSGDYLQSGQFFKLREASMNYRLPQAWAQRYARATSASVGITFRNLKTWTDFTGFDPETSQFLTVPSDKRWTLRFNVTF